MRLRINDKDVILHDIRANNLTKHKSNKSNVLTIIQSQLIFRQ